MIVSAIAAMAKNRTIGLSGRLPWKIPEDFRYFKDMTAGHIVIMGRKTFESLPGLLPGRFHIVITRQSNYTPRFQNPSDEPAVLVVSDVDEAVAAAEAMILSEPEWGEEVFNIGGAEIYSALLPLTDRIYLTEIDSVFTGDAHFPDLPAGDFLETVRRPGLTSGTNGLPSFDFVIYERNA